MSREYGHHADDLLFDNQRIACEGDHALALRPFLIMNARVADHLIGQMRFPLFGNETDFEFADRYRL
jgi:hypothetical protein